MTPCAKTQLLRKELYIVMLFAKLFSIFQDKLGNSILHTLSVPLSASMEEGEEDAMRHTSPPPPNTYQCPLSLHFSILFTLLRELTDPTESEVRLWKSLGQSMCVTLLKSARQLYLLHLFPTSKGERTFPFPLAV